MEELKRIVVFSQVAQASSISGAAKQLNVAKSAISKQVSQLEKELNTQLLHRTTRGLRLTEAGAIYLNYCQEILALADQARTELRHHQNLPSGKLRIASPISFGLSHVIPVTAQLQNSYNNLTFDLVFDDRRIDLLQEGIDVAIRMGAMPDSNLIAKRIGTAPIKLFASPDYLATFGTPQTPQDLLHHQWIALNLLKNPAHITLRHRKTLASQQLILPKSSVSTNSGDALVALMVQGMGIAATTTIHPQLNAATKQGLLEAVLTDYDINPLGIYAVYHKKSHIPAKVKVFVAFLETYFKQHSIGIAQ